MVAMAVVVPMVMHAVAVAVPVVVPAVPVLVTAVVTLRGHDGLRLMAHLGTPTVCPTTCSPGNAHNMKRIRELGSRRDPPGHYFDGRRRRVPLTASDRTG
jgi:hypothetical protein